MFVAMFRSASPRWRRLLSSLAYSALVATVAGLGYLTSHTISERRQQASTAQPSPESATPPLVDIANFSTRQERNSDSERLMVSVRVRLTAPGSVECYAYVIARNDHVSPKLWAVWPPQGPGGALSAGGHFRVTNPTTGQPLKLTPSWTRITATLDHPLGHPPFESATVYVVSSTGEILLSRPFTL